MQNIGSQACGQGLFAVLWTAVIDFEGALPMGWRAQDAYDCEERERIRALPLRERYAWGRIAFIGAGAVIVSAVRWWIG